MSISFTCLFLSLSLSFSSYYLYHYLVYFLRKEKKTSNLFTFLVLCVRVFLKETCVENKNCEKNEDEIPLYVYFFFFCLCVYGSRFICRLSFFFFLFVSCCCVPNCVFFMPPLLLPPPLFSSIYLLSDCVCVCMCVSFYYLLCVCVRACRSLILFCCSLFTFFLFRLLKKLPNLFTT